jgi:hypothetical protein
MMVALATEHASLYGIGAVLIAALGGAQRALTLRAVRR